MFRDKVFRISLVFFVLLHILLYVFISTNYWRVPFATSSYLYESHHYVDDSRSNGGEFNFLRSLGVWDAQWYLRIADDGYPPREVFESYSDPRFMGGLTYAFFPFYPLILFLFNFVFRNIELSAFIVSNIILLANFVSLYYVVTKLFSKSIAIRTIFLLFLFPFSIFYRSYFTEGIFLLLLIWFTYFLIKHKWFFASLVASLLFVTRPNGLFLGVILFGALIFAVRRHKLFWSKAILYLMLSVIPFMIWCYYSFLLTGDYFYWHQVQSVWFKSPSVFHTFARNMQHLTGFFEYPIHTTRQSKIDIIILILTFGLLLWSKRFLKKYPQLWWASFMIWITPLLVKDLMSYSRYQIISFPIFIFLASKLTGWKFYLVSTIFIIFLFFTSIYLVNWQWVG